LRREQSYFTQISKGLQEEFLEFGQDFSGFLPRAICPISGDLGKERFSSAITARLRLIPAKFDAFCDLSPPEQYSTLRLLAQHHACLPFSDPAVSYTHLTLPTN
jgi:hypothetical protein